MSRRRSFCHHLPRHVLRSVERGDAAILRDRRNAVGGQAQQLAKPVDQNVVVAGEIAEPQPGHGIRFGKREASDRAIRHAWQRANAKTNNQCSSVSNGFSFARSCADSIKQLQKSKCPTRGARVLTMREKREYNVSVIFVLANDLMRYASERKSTNGRLAIWTKQSCEIPSACSLTRLCASAAGAFWLAKR